MKVFLCLLTLALLATSSMAQVETYGVSGVGALTQKGEASVVAAFGGANTKIYSDSSGNFSVLNRTAYFYANTTDEIQGISSFLINKKTIHFGNVGIFAALGGGILYEIQEGQDDNSAALLMETGVDLWKFIGVGLGVTYVPLPGEDDQFLFYGMIDLFP